MVERTNETIIKATKLLNEYEIGSARHEIDDLFWKDFCDNYIEIVKSRLYEPDIHGHEERKSGQYALYYALFNILKMYSIYVPHITDYIYSEFFKQHENLESIHLLQWEQPESVDNNILRFGEYVIDAVSDVRKYKSENNLSMRSEMDKLGIKCDLEFLEWFKKTEMDLKYCANAKTVYYL